MFILPRTTSVVEADAPSPAADHRWPWDDGWPWDKHGWPWDHPGGPAARPSAAMSRAERRAWRHQRRAARMGHGPPTIGSSMLIVLFVFIAFAWLAFWMRGTFFWGGPIFWGGPFFWRGPHWVGIVLLVVLFRYLLWPVRAARWGWYGYPGYGLYPYSPWAAMWHAVVWVATIVFLIWLASQFIPGFHEFLQQFQTRWPTGRFDV
jgi:hypothetical protein